MDPARIAAIFDECDSDRDGLITVDELRQGVRRLRMPLSATSLQGFLAVVDADHDGRISYSEFLAAVLTQQERLKRAFRDIDRGGDNRITSRDIERFATKLGYALSHDEVVALLQHMDRNKDGHVDLSEFCEFFMTTVGDVNAEGLFESWLRASPISAIAIEDSPQADAPAWVLLVAGALAGITSRTLTAPADRIKTLLQASDPVCANRVATAPQHAPPPGAARAQPRGGDGAVRVYRFTGETTARAVTLSGVAAPPTAAPANAFARTPYSFGAGTLSAISHASRRVSATGAVQDARVASYAPPWHDMEFPTPATPPRPRAGAPMHVAGIRHAFQSILHDGGVRGLWRGNGVNVMKVAPETAAKFWAYETLKTMLCDDVDNITLQERFAAGAGAGAFAQALIYPFEVAKTRITLGGEYHNLVHCMSATVSKEGPRALYRGMLASLIGIVPYSGVDLTVFSLLKEAYERRFPTREPGLFTLLLCGAVSTTVGQVVSYPLQLVRTRLQAQGMPGRPILYDGILDCIMKTLARDGVRGLYKGLAPNFMKSVPAMAISYATYELSKRGLMLWRRPTAA